MPSETWGHRPVIPALFFMEIQQVLRERKTMAESVYSIVDVRKYYGGLEEAVRYIHGKWGRPENLDFYRDAIEHYGTQLPRFFLLLAGNRISGCGALIANDFISRHDLWPWYACHFIEPAERGRGLGQKLLNHGVRLAAELGFRHVYLTTGHDGYYEKYGWERIEDGFEPSGARTRIYRYSLQCI